MGASYSDEGRSEREAVKVSRNAYMKSVSNHRKNQAQTDRIDRIKEWRQVLADKLSEEEDLEIPQWNLLKNEIVQYVKAIPEEQNVEWLVNVQFTSLASSTYCSQFSNRDERVLDLDQFTKDKMTKSQYTTKTWSQIEPASAMTHAKRFEERTLSTFCPSPKLTARSHVFSSFQSKASAKKELRKNLLNQIKSPNHIVYGLIKHFALISERLFDQYNKDLTFAEYDADHDEAYTCVATVMKRFVTALKVFVCWIYEDLLIQLEGGLDNEDISPECVIESIIYDKLFRKLHPTATNFLYKLLGLKYKTDIEKFKQAILEKKPESLASYDDIFTRNEDYLLKDSAVPYKRVFKVLNNVRQEINPYAKFEVISSVIDEMWNCISEHHRDESHQLKLKEGFAMDIKIPIFVYSIVQSQCESLVIERKIIEEFVHPQALDASLGFTTFQSSMDFFLIEESNEEGEEF